MSQTLRLAAIAAAILSTAAFAQTNDKSSELRPKTLGPANAPENLPPPRTTKDPLPPAPAPRIGAATGTIVQQAGVGGPTAYSRRGVVELGGSAALTTSSNLTTFSVNPSIGWFFVDNFELSAILGAQYSRVNGNDSAFLTALVEPSFHLPFSNSVFGFVGVGVGVGYVTDVGAGFALAPRLGANILIGRSGVLSPAAFLNYSTAGVANEARTQTIRVNATFGAQIGYTVML